MRLTESQLKSLIKERVLTVLKENFAPEFYSDKQSMDEILGMVNEKIIELEDTLKNLEGDVNKVQRIADMCLGKLNRMFGMQKGKFDIYRLEDNEMELIYDVPAEALKQAIEKLPSYQEEINQIGDREGAYETIFDGYASDYLNDNIDGCKIQFDARTNGFYGHKNPHVLVTLENVFIGL